MENYTNLFQNKLNPYGVIRAEVGDHDTYTMVWSVNGDEMDRKTRHSLIVIVYDSGLTALYSEGEETIFWLPFESVGELINYTLSIRK